MFAMYLLRLYNGQPLYETIRCIGTPGFHIYDALPATLLKLTLLHGCFSRLLNSTNATKSRKA